MDIHLDGFYEAMKEARQYLIERPVDTEGVRQDIIRGRGSPKPPCPPPAMLIDSLVLVVRLCEFRGCEFRDGIAGLFVDFIWQTSASLCV